jgi:hypothetical protein
MLKTKNFQNNLKNNADDLILPNIKTYYKVK